jgi:hypothetical protein
LWLRACLLLRSWSCLGLGWTVLRLRCRSRLWLRTCLLLRSWSCLGLGWTVLRLCWTRLWLNGARLRLARAGLRLARPCWLNLWPVLRLAGSSGLNGWLAGSPGLNGWLARPGLGLFRTIRRLTRTVAGLGAEVGPRDAGLRGDRSCGDGNGGAALVLIEELLTVRGRFALVLQLGGHGRCTGSAHGCYFSRLRPNVEAASAAVVGDAVAHVAILNRAAVDVIDAGGDAVDGAVVVEVISIPIPAVIAAAGVAEAVVDAAVEADIAAPVAAMEAPAVAIEAPVAGGPEGAVVGGSAPGAGNPVVAAGAPGPVAGGPEVVGIGGLGLLVDGELRGWLVGVVLWLDGVGIGVELVVVLGVLIAGVGLIGRRRCLLLGVLLGALLGRGLRAYP